MCLNTRRGAASRPYNTSLTDSVHWSATPTYALIDLEYDVEWLKVPPLVGGVEANANILRVYGEKRAPRQPVTRRVSDLCRVADPRTQRPCR